MDQKKSNNAIQCTVSECAYHNDEKSTCSLEAIRVGCCGPTTHNCDCTECASFKKGK